MSQDGTEYTKDEHLRAAILKTFADNEILAPLDLRVGVLNAIAHLGGNAPSPELWAEAERITAAIPGVRGVVNRIAAPGAPRPARMVNLNLDISSRSPTSSGNSGRRKSLPSRQRTTRHRRNEPLKRDSS